MTFRTSKASNRRVFHGDRQVIRIALEDVKHPRLSIEVYDDENGRAYTILDPGETRSLARLLKGRRR